MPTIDIAFIGGGPQALRALVELDDALAGVPGPRLRIVAIDPHPPGAGAVWRVDQPDHLRMNVPADLVDLRCASAPWSLSEWHRRTLHTPCPRFPARRVVGAYLTWVWDRLARSERWELLHVPARADRVDPEPSGWAVSFAGPAAPPLRARRVVLCTGHRYPAGADHETLADPLGADPRDALVVRGAALTAFDVVMGATEGRGGRWRPSEDGAAAARTPLVYVPSGTEPRRITLLSRTGRMMLPKPEEPSSAAVDAVRALHAEWGRRDPLGEAWWDLLVEAARRAARAQGVSVSYPALRAVLDAPPRCRDTAAVRDRWHQDLRRARGEVDEDPAWWLGRAWSAAHRDVLASIERLPRSADTWPVFRRRAASLERWAFGPPAELVARLCALIDADLLAVETAVDAEEQHAIRAYIAGPGVLESPRPWTDEEDEARGPEHTDERGDADPLWARLLRTGAVTVRRGESGVLTAPDAACIGHDGTPTPGLAALGRPTEGPVVDHDSLSRDLHLDARRWAASVARDLTADAFPETRTA